MMKKMDYTFMEGYEYLAKLIGEKLKGFYKKQSDIALLFIVLVN